MGSAVSSSSTSSAGAPGGKYAAQDATVEYSPAAPTRSSSNMIRLTYAYGSQMGRRPHGRITGGRGLHLWSGPQRERARNQDALLLRPFLSGIQHLHLFGVFDGHGDQGHLVSAFVRDRIEVALLHELRAAAAAAAAGGGAGAGAGAGGSGPGKTGALATVGDLPSGRIVEACKKAFLALEEALGKSLTVDETFSGTTALVALLVGTRLFVASAGDSRAVLGISGSNPQQHAAVDALTHDHNPYRSDEMARILAQGGLVMNHAQLASATGPDAGRPSSSWKPFDPIHGVDTSLDPPRVWDASRTKPGCCFTRSLGDSYAKTLGVIAVPEVACRDLAPQLKAGAPLFLCLGSDGVFEQRSSQTLVDLMAALPVGAPLLPCVKTVCNGEDLPLEGQQQHRDDTTLICVRIEAGSSWMV